MLKTLLHYRNPDSTQDIITMLSGFFKKGLVSGGVITPVFPNTAPQVTVSPFKLIGQDGMVVLETSDTVTLNLNPNATTLICFKSEYVSGTNPIATWQTIDLVAYNSMSQGDKDLLVIFGSVVTTAANALPTVDYGMRDVVDPVGRNTLRGLVSSSAALPPYDPALGTADNPLLGDAYIVESGIPLDSNNGLWVYKGASQGWVNITNSLSIGTLLAQHRSNFFINEQHLNTTQIGAIAGTYGSPSGSNPFVTSLDPRVPTQSENDALVGYSQPLAVSPSATNPYVTAAYNIGEPSDAIVTYSGGAYLTLSSGSGPFYVGLGVNSASILPYFDLLDATYNREFVNSSGNAVKITGVYKSIPPSTPSAVPLVPSAETTVTQSEGFYSGTLYFSFSNPIDTGSSVRIRFAVQSNFQTIDRSLSIKDVYPITSAETLERLRDISGRLMDDPMQTGESNVELKNSQVSLRTYLNTATTADLIIPCTEFAHLRQVSDIEADFAANYADIQMFGATTANYTVKWSNTDVAGFDPAYTEDVPNLAIITYAIGTTLPAIQPGWTWVDDLGNLYRVLAFDGVRSLLIYTAGQAVNTNNASGNQSKIWLSNNPRRLEISEDFQTSMYREFFAIEDIVPASNQFDVLPPGGVFVGSYVPVNNFSLIGTSILPNQGNPNGAPLGRPLFYVEPFNAKGSPDRRLVLIGNWESDPVDYPNQALGNFSAGGLGIEYTGRLTDITLYTSINPSMSYGFRVFIDGVYSNSASQFLLNAQLSSEVPSNVINNLRGSTEKQLMPILFNNLGLSDNLIHTVRIEITQSGNSFPLYAVDTFYNGSIEAQGRLFCSADYINISSDNTVASPVPASVRGSRVVRYIDRTLQTRQVANSVMPAAASITTIISASATSFVDTILAQSCFVGDVLLFTTRSSIIQQDPVNWAYRQVTGIDRVNSTVTINASLGFALPSGGYQRVEKVFSIPSAPNGTPICGAPQDTMSSEYARFYLADWTNGLQKDIANLSTISSDSRTTVLDDGSTALSVVGCRQVKTGIEGFPVGIRFESTSSVMTLNSWGTRADVVFSGAGNVSSTIQIEVDGLWTYTITVPNNGLVRHTLYFSASPQSHTVRIMNPSLAASVVVSQWILYTIAAPAINGTPISEYEVPRNSTAATSNYSDFAPTSLTTPTVVSNSGVRIFDITKYGSRFYEGAGGTQNWTAAIDYVNNPRFGYVLSTDRTNAFFEINFVGSSFELQYLAGPNAGIAQFYIDGLVASSSNYVSQIFAQGYVGATGQVDMYAASSVPQRFVVVGLSQGQHVVRVQVTGTKNGLSSGYFLSPISAAENPGTAVVCRRNLADNLPNHLHFQSFRDLRNFISITPDPIGSIYSNAQLSNTSGLQLGYINAAFAMSDGSGTPLNCSLSIVGGVTVADISFAWTSSVNPGTTVGDLEVIVDGAVIPRYIAGATQDAWYKEDPVIAGRIVFWADLSAVAVSVEFRRKAGTVDSSTTNTGRISTQSGIVVGSTSQRLAGIADYDNLTDAITAVSVGGLITLLPGVNSTENIVLNKRVSISGSGYDSYINGTFTCQSGCQHSLITGIRVSQFILQAGATKNQIATSFWAVAPTDANPGGSNSITGMLG